MIEIENFTPAHLDMFVPGHFDGAVNDWEFREYLLSRNGQGLTAVIDGKVVGCLFITEPVNGVSEVQVYGSDDARKKHWLWIGLAFRRGIETVPKNLGIERLRVKVMEGFGKSRAWVERLGFEAMSQADGVIIYERAA